MRGHKYDESENDNIGFGAEAYSAGDNGCQERRGVGRAVGVKILRAFPLSDL